jgi:hypothetical protein
LVAGLLSTLLYRVFKALLINKATTPGQFGGYPYPGGYPGGYPYSPVVTQPGGIPGVITQPGVVTQPGVIQPGIAQAGVITPDNPANPTDMDNLAAQVRQTINK